MPHAPNWKGQHKRHNDCSDDQPYNKSIDLSLFPYSFEYKSIDSMKWIFATEQICGLRIPPWSTASCHGIHK